MKPSDVTPAELPSPKDRPHALVVIFDGSCMFCQGQVARLARWDSRQSLAFLSLHDEEVKHQYPDLTYNQLMEQMYVVDSQGKYYGGAAAFRCLSRQLPRMWPLALLLHVPFSLPFWQWAYRQVARRRYLISGNTQCEGDACNIHLGRK